MSTEKSGVDAQDERRELVGWTLRVKSEVPRRRRREDLGESGNAGDGVERAREKSEVISRVASLRGESVSLEMGACSTTAKAHSDTSQVAADSQVRAHPGRLEKVPGGSIPFAARLLSRLEDDEVADNRDAGDQTRERLLNRGQRIEFQRGRRKLTSSAPRQNGFVTDASSSASANARSTHW